MGQPRQSNHEMALTETLRSAIYETQTAEREQALVEVTGILGWLTASPKIPTEKLAEYVLAEFERAAGKLPETSFFHKRIEEYREILKRGVKTPTWDLVKSLTDPLSRDEFRKLIDTLLQDRPKKEPDPEEESQRAAQIQHSIDNLNLADKESLVELLFQVQNGYVSARRAATEILNRIP